MTAPTTTLSEEDLKLIFDFHRHYCPMVLLGARQAKFAREYPFKSASSLPYAFYRGYGCALDGVQLFGHCTMGNGNLTLLRGRDFSLIYSHEGSSDAVLVRPLPELLDEIRTNRDSSLESSLSRRIINGPVDDIFTSEDVEGPGILTQYPEG